VELRKDEHLAKEDSNQHVNFHEAGWREICLPYKL
jgi:hypothetical protein